MMESDLVCAARAMVAATFTAVLALAGCEAEPSAPAPERSAFDSAIAADRGARDAAPGQDAAPVVDLGPPDAQPAADAAGVSDAGDGPLAGKSAISSYPISTAAALARPASQITVVNGAQSTAFTVGAPGADHTFDMRAFSSTAFPSATLYPVTIGKAAPAPRTAVVGGLVVGKQATTLTWREMKQSYDGAGILIHSTSGGDWMIVDGVRYENQMDDLRPRSAARFAFRNIWSRNTRDDVIENDAVLGGQIHDCLFESAYMFLSEQNGTWNGKYSLELSHLLVRLEPMPYDTDMKNNAPAPGSLVNGRGHGQLFKHFASSGDTPLEVHDCLFYVSQLSVNGPAAMAFPSNATYKNNTLIWVGGGSYPGQLPASGVTELNLKTHSRAALDKVWDDAVAVWKTRHGVTDFTNVKMAKLIHPDPFPP